MRFILACLATFVSSTAAYQISTPASGDKVSIQAGTTITWTAVDTDPLSFDLWLVNMAHWPNYAKMIARGIKRDDRSYPIRGVPDVPLGDGYQFNFVRPNGDVKAPLAQSTQFSVTKGTF
ncbi:Ser-Thr-rich glycosyl-phosphatidyl-inositol-anchored membrane family-domain-containing protein [Aspergillus bertholletiae]|uniref:Ser-Thr-rich glycosyl-phosphatidyl-inositol-anchored membrane family-domain-containing protein n=1 Tax=Aspergillus bertholletiae TaxID=1226010 RepID=A0A5N7B102_9EURO|nr:Ser-Thr-rich glycosyl-phosphatidyl-inositol-anchored membrane family-domain-containing protein [Aspergillus bertholletiae]